MYFNKFILKFDERALIIYFEANRIYHPYDWQQNITGMILM